VRSRQVDEASHQPCRAVNANSIPPDVRSGKRESRVQISQRRIGLGVRASGALGPVARYVRSYCRVNEDSCHRAYRARSCCTERIHQLRRRIPRQHGAHRRTLRATAIRLEPERRRYLRRAHRSPVCSRLSRRKHGASFGATAPARVWNGCDENAAFRNGASQRPRASTLFVAAVLKIGNALPRRARITPSRVDVHVGLAGDVLGASAWRYA